MSKTVAVIDGSARALILVRGPLLDAIIDAGHSVYVIAPVDSNMPDLQISDLAERFANKGIIFNKWNLDRQGKNLISDILAFIYLYREIRRIRPDIVLSYSAKSSIYGSIAAFLADVPASYSAMTGLGYLFDEDNGKPSMLQILGRKLIRYAISKNIKIFFQNSDDIQYFINIDMIKRKEQVVLVNGSGVDINQFNLCGLPEGAITFLMVARLQVNKGVREYVSAARILKIKYPYVRFKILGPFDDHPSAISLEEVSEWKSEGFVEYLGGTSDVRPYLAGCHVFVLPSYREGTPRSTLEALATGRPVVTTDVPGCRETVEVEGNGFLVTVKDPVSLASGMEKFIENPDLIRRMGARSRQIAEEKYDVRKIVASMMAAMDL